MNRQWFYIRIPFKDYPEMYEIMKEVKPQLDKLHGILLKYGTKIQSESEG